MTVSVPCDTVLGTVRDAAARTCECDCARWAHLVSRVCEQETAVSELTLMFFESDLNPTGTFSRRMCGPCAEHIEFARSRGGEHLAYPAAVPSSPRCSTVRRCC